MKTIQLLLGLLLCSFLHAQKSGAGNLVFVDKKGVLRYTKDKSEAAFFGVNYTVPFAYGYRSHKALGVDLEKAIDADVRHMARLGLDAFRVHVWDVEITDSLGNLLANEHLRLFDYLLKKLKENNIKILVTPIAFWGNGYPEPDEKLKGFSAVYGKGPSVVREEAIKAQENYLKQFFLHVNPYTKLSYKDDPDVIATEINNEPHHSGPKEKTTDYVNRLAAAIRGTGWTKPVFYNISESPSYAGAVVKANVDGHSFQWYPTGLVAGREQKGNFLPNVDQYRIPFLDTLPAFKNRALMVYEFDAADVLQPIMYPAMARAFRTAGFQWATQFAYDPLHTAYANTEYQTHYLNLVYTPAKAISLLIASKIFHRVPRGKSYGSYPADTLFDVFRISYKEQLSEMNSEEEFYYSASTTTQPKDVSRLKHIAGVGNSPVVQYTGTGAYFLDRVENGTWQVEVMPDAVIVGDPFEKASPKKEVVRLQHRLNRLRANLPGLTKEFFVRPGTYLLNSKGLDTIGATVGANPFGITADVSVLHRPASEVSAGKPFAIRASVAGIDTSATLSLELRNSANGWRTVPLQRIAAHEYKADVPADMTNPGVISYRIMVKKANGETYTFPGGIKGNPYAWDEWRNENYQTFVAAPGSPLELFNPTTDRNKLMLYNPDWRANTVEYTAADKPRQLVMKATVSKPAPGQYLGWQVYFGDKTAGRRDELSSFTKLVIRARASQATKAKLSLITTEADAFAGTVALSTEWKEIEIPLGSLQKSDLLLLPRGYPGFQPLTFTSSGTKPFNVADAEKLEFRFGEGAAVSVEVEGVWLKK